MDVTASMTKFRTPPPDPATLVVCAWRYKWLALLAGFLFAGMGAAAGYVVIPARFEASALVRITNPNWVVDRRQESAADSRQFRSTQRELLQTSHVLKRALESQQVKDLGILGTDSSSIGALRGWLKVELPGTSEILRIAIQHDRADVAFLLANAVAEAYLLEINRDAEETLKRRLAVLDKLHATTEDRLSQAWDSFRDLTRQLGTGDLAALSLQTQGDIENYRDSTRRLQELRVQKREAERIIKSIRENPDDFAVEIPEETTASVRYALFQAILRTEQELAKWGPNHPNVLSARQNENYFREYYQKTMTEQEERPPKTREEQLLAEPLAKLARLKAEEDALVASLREIDDRMQLLAGDNVAGLEVLRNDIRRMEQLSDRIWEARETAEVERHADRRVQLVTFASLPGQRDTSKRNKIGLVLAAGGFGFAVLLVAMGEFFTGRLHSAREATYRTSLVVLASLPRLPETVVDSCRSGRERRIMTQLDKLVARLTHDSQAGKLRVILVTSSSRRRERERLAVHLAAAFSRTGQRTVFVNFDLRSQPDHVVFPDPTGVIEDTATHRISDDTLTNERADDVAWRMKNSTLDKSHAASPTLGDSRGASFAAMLESRHAARIESGQDRPFAARNPFPAEMPLVGTGVANMDLLQPTRLTTEPLSVFAHPELPELLEALKNLYAYVVIEAPEVLNYPDAMHLGHLADVSLLAVQRNRSVAYSVVKALSKLAQHGRPIFGVMID